MTNFPNGAKCEAVTSINHSADTFRVEARKGWLDFQEKAFSYRGIVCQTSRGPLTFPAINQQAAQMDDFAECILTGRKTPVPGEIGRHDMRIITAVYEAARAPTNESAFGREYRFRLTPKRCSYDSCPVVPN
jgi:glucose-fructose oxidoreductase